MNRRPQRPWLADMIVYDGLFVILSLYSTSLLYVKYWMLLPLRFYQFRGVHNFVHTKQIETMKVTGLQTKKQKFWCKFCRELLQKQKNFFLKSI